mmetsp:Transcript_93012/g.164450  ORF Transcript_93012/g.164450 Transcript_93012/m.164450 type:complete len:418 (-) Transcript_93012:126-1379(-)
MRCFVLVICFLACLSCLSSGMPAAEHLISSRFVVSQRPQNGWQAHERITPTRTSDGLEALALILEAHILPAAFNPSGFGARSLGGMPFLAASRSEVGGRHRISHHIPIMKAATLKSRKTKAQGSKRKLRKTHSQNFLVDAEIIGQMIDGLQKNNDGHSGDLVLEIGPGEGAITRHLLQRDSRPLVAVELDPMCISPLTALMKEAGNTSDSQPRFLFHHADALKLSWSGIGAQRLGVNVNKMDVCANIPFGITSKLLYKALDEDRVIRRMVLLMQQEVVDKLTAAPTDGRSYSSLSVEFQLRGSVQVLNHCIPKEAFWPPPKVNTALVLVDWGVGKAHPEVQNWSDQHWVDLRRVLYAAFNARALDLRESLREIVDPKFLKVSEDGARWWHSLSGPDLTPAKYAKLVTELTSAGAFVH